MNGADSESRLREISDTLVGARREGAALPGFPGALPETLEDAYAVQLYSLAAWHDEVGGWKVGGVPAAYLDRFDETKLTGPIFKQKIFHAENGSQTHMEVLPGFAAVEGEWVFCLGETPAEDTLHIGIEVASTVLPAINKLGPVAAVCDFGNNNGLIVGPEITDWRARDPGTIHLQTEICGEVVGTKDVTNFPHDGLESLAFLRAHTAKHGIDLPAGTYCASGAITGVHQANPGDSGVCHFGEFGSLGIKFVACGVLPDAL